MLRLIFLLILYLFSTNTIFAQTVIDLQNPNLPKYLGEYCKILEDKEGQFSITEVINLEKQALFKASTNEVPNFQITPFTYWLQFELKNNSQEKFFLEIDKGDIDSLSLYHIQADTVTKVFHIGQLVPFKTRFHQGHQFIFPLNLVENTTQTFFIRVKSIKPLAIPLVIAKESTMTWLSYRQDITQGMYFGFALLIILYNLFIWFSVRDKLYLIYVVYVAMLSITLADFKGISASLLFVNFESFNPYTIGIYGVAGSLANIFSVLFLETKRQLPKNHKILVFLILCYFISALLGFLGFRFASCISVNAIALISSFYLLYTSWILYKQGFKPAKFYLYAFGSFLFCVIAQFSGNLGLLPANAFTLQAMQLGSAAEMLLLSLALADKINSLKVDNEKAKADLLVIVQEQNAVLEQKVATRTQELHENNMMLEVQNEEIKQQQEELLTINETLGIQHIETELQKQRAENTLIELQDTTQRLNQSIKYAQNIQQVILPDTALINSFFKEHFTIYLPKDVVSGDFYWFTNLSDTIIDNQSYQRALFALADCTGHGVPGAFVTMVCNTLLYEAVEIAKIESPAKILQNLDIRIQKILRQHEGKNSDGLDISLCLFEKQAHQKIEITFAGSHTYIYYFENLTHAENHIITKMSGDRITIGGNSNNKQKFNNQIFTQQKGQVIYFSTDGYTDQNDANRNRLGLQNLRTMLGAFQNTALNEQKQILIDALNQHQKEQPQRDDISVVGLLM